MYKLPEGCFLDNYFLGLIKSMVNIYLSYMINIYKFHFETISLYLEWLLCFVSAEQTVKESFEDFELMDVNHVMTYELCGTLSAFGPQNTKKGILNIFSEQ